jgi:hypothetical protein
MSHRHFTDPLRRLVRLGLLASVLSPVSIALAGPAAESEPLPFQISIDCPRVGGGACQGSVQAPAQHRIVIEFVSALCTLDANGQTLTDVGLVTQLGGGARMIHVLNLVDHAGSRAPGSNWNHVDVAQVVRIYADAGSAIDVFANSNGILSANALPACSVVISGHTLDGR